MPAIPPLIKPANFQPVIKPLTVPTGTRENLLRRSEFQRYMKSYRVEQVLVPFPSFVMNDDNRDWLAIDANFTATIDGIKMNMALPNASAFPLANRKVNIDQLIPVLIYDAQTLEQLLIDRRAARKTFGTILNNGLNYNMDDSIDLRLFSGGQFTSNDKRVSWHIIETTTELHNVVVSWRSLLNVADEAQVEKWIAQIVRLRAETLSALQVDSTINMQATYYEYQQSIIPSDMIMFGPILINISRLMKKRSDDFAESPTAPKLFKRLDGLITMEQVTVVFDAFINRLAQLIQKKNEITLKIKNIRNAVTFK